MYWRRQYCYSVDMDSRVSEPGRRSGRIASASGAVVGRRSDSITRRVVAALTSVILVPDRWLWAVPAVVAFAPLYRPGSVTAPEGAVDSDR